MSKPLDMEEYLVIRIRRRIAMSKGLLSCTCGHPFNNHFDLEREHGLKGCAHCPCKGYEETMNCIGEIIK